VLRVLPRIIADVNDVAGHSQLNEEKRVQGDCAEARRVRHWQRLAEPEPPPKQRTMGEKRAALRALLEWPQTGKS
jgi:hypothetical protein